MEIKKVSGKNVWKEERIYELELMDAETGLDVMNSVLLGLAANFHQIIKKFPKIQELLSQGENANNFDIGMNVVEVIQVLPDLIDTRKILTLSKQLLTGAKIVVDGKEYKCNDNGLAEYMARDPLEVYTAILYAVTANFPKYYDFLFSALGQQGDTDPDATTMKPKA